MAVFNDQRESLAWGVAGVIAATCAVWLPFSRLTFVANAAFFGPIAGAIFLVAINALLGVAIARTHDRALVRFVRPIALRCDLIARAFALNIALFGGAVTFSYLSAAASFPLQDGTFAAIDRALGFDWIAFLRLTNTSAVFARMLSLAYMSTHFQFIALTLCLALAGWSARLMETLAILSLCLVATLLPALAFPAAGAAAYYKPAAHMLTHFSPLSGLWHYAAFAGLRGEHPVLDFAVLKGVVQFPSFHTQLALLTTFALRGVRWALIPIAILNALVIVATLPEGGHHLIDVIAGAAIFAVCAFAVARRKTSYARSAGAAA
jgi:membrane-associated phospholipid phosphatase